jgi:hypothetical protein
MHTLSDDGKMKATIKTAGAVEFFQRGRDVAKAADQGKKIPREKIIAFEELKQTPTPSPPNSETCILSLAVPVNSDG